MRGQALPINTVVIITLAVMVLIAILFFVATFFTQGSQGIKDLQRDATCSFTGTCDVEEQTFSPTSESPISIDNDVGETPPPLESHTPEPVILIPVFPENIEVTPESCTGSSRVQVNSFRTETIIWIGIQDDIIVTALDNISFSDPADIFYPCNTAGGVAACASDQLDVEEPRCFEPQSDVTGERMVIFETNTPLLCITFHSDGTISLLKYIHFTECPLFA